MRRFWLFAALAWALAAPAFAQTAVVPWRSARATFTDPNGAPLAGGCIFTYAGGTSSPQATYTDYTGGTANPNPVPLDSTGSAVMWLSANAYKFVAYSAGGTDCATGSPQWTVDQIPGDTFINGTISGATIQNGTISGAAITGGSMNGAPINASTLSTSQFSTLAAGTTNGVLNPAMCAAAPSPAWCSGSDMGAWINAAFIACSNVCTVEVPTGTYTYGTTIAEPSSAESIALVCESGVSLQYSGSGDAFDLFSASAGFGGAQGCAFVGTSAAAAGIHVRGPVSALFLNVTASDFTAGDCILNEGDGSGVYIGSSATYCKNGVHNVGLSGGSVAQNVHFIGGSISDNTQYGAFEDASLSGSVGLNSKNTYEDTVFAGNAIAGFVQGCSGCTFRDNVIGPSTGASNLVLGDSSYAALVAVIENNLFNGGSLTNDVSLVNAQGAVVESNSEPNLPTNFINNGSLSAGTFVEGNRIPSAVVKITGSGTLILPGVRSVSDFCGSTAGSAGTYYFPGLGSALGGSCAVAQLAGAGFQLPAQPGTLSNLSMRCATSGVNSSSGAATLEVVPSGTATTSPTSTSITVTYGTTAANTAVTDTTHTYTYPANSVAILTLTAQASETLANCTVSFDY